MNRTQIESLTGSELVAYYNSLPGVKPVKRFASRADALKRVLAAAPAEPAKAAARKPAKAAAAKPAAEPSGPVPPPAAPTPAPAVAPAPAAQERPAAAPAKPAARAYAAAPGGKAPRPGSKRGQLLALLREPAGVSAQEGMERFGWKAADFKDAIYLTAKKNGVAVACGEDGRWRAQ